MAISSGFRDFVLDQLSGVRGLRAKAMFGGVGLYSADIFFGLLSADVLYLKVDDTTRGDFERAGSTPFRPPRGRPTTMSYYSVPPATLEDAADLAEWAKRAIVVARRR